MKHFFTLIFTSFLFSHASLAAESPAKPVASAKVEKLMGKVRYNGKELHEGDVLKTNGLMVTEKGSFVRLHMEIWSTSIVIGPNTKMDLDLTSPKDAAPKRYQLLNGLCRWISKMKSDQMKGGHVFTKSASMGVRGTDFEIQAREETGETEVIVFDGKVLLKSTLADSEALIEKGQWGGVGGKFGNTIAKPIDLPPAALQQAKERSAAFVVGK